MSKNPTDRLLIITTLIAQQGPITLADLTTALPDISRASIWRAVDTLRRHGWVRMRHGDQAFMLTHVVDQLMAETTTAPLGITQVDEFIENLPKGAQFAVGMFTVTGRFEVLESTDENYPIGRTPDLLEDDFAFGALASFDRATILRHIKAWMATRARPDQSNWIKSGGLKDRLNAHTPLPYLHQFPPHGLFVFVT